ncbi:MAG TPA: hypothetical protein VNW49_06650 [Puia sp.]|nr:hypothetical protein [Puia sp.]
MPKKKRSNTTVFIDDDFPDLSKDPVFIAKHEKAEKLITEFGIPEAFKTKPRKAKGLKRKA